MVVAVCCWLLTVFQAVNHKVVLMEYNFDGVSLCGWSGQALAALNKQEEACQVWQTGYESALGLPEELPYVVQLHSLAMGNFTTEPPSKSSAEVT